MKRYIRASITTSAPDWLRRELKSSFGKELVRKKGIALERAEFLDHEPEEGHVSLPIYLLRDDYGNKIYAPGINDQFEAIINRRTRKLGSIAKSKLPEMAVDVVWLDLDDPVNKAERGTRYQDPRYSYYRNDTKGKYAGQYKRREYIGHGEYEDAGWSEEGLRPSNESRSRDKSGYKVPTPEDMITRFYSKFPERITQKVDSVYDQIIETRDEIINSDFKSARRYGSNYRNALSRLGEAIDTYRNLLDDISENGTLKEADIYYDGKYAFSHFASKISEIKSDLEDARRYLRES